eukprot:scaffold5115_cov113-Isochrysis_galbana.AAC.11
MKPSHLLLVVVVVQVLRGLLGNVEDRLELDLSLGREVGVGERLANVLGERLVEGRVLVLGNIRGVARPERLGVVDELPVGDCFGHHLGFGRLLLLVGILDLVLLGAVRLLLSRRGRRGGRERRGARGEGGADRRQAQAYARPSPLTQRSVGAWRFRRANRCQHGLMRPISLHRGVTTSIDAAARATSTPQHPPSSTSGRTRLGGPFARASLSPEAHLFLLVLLLGLVALLDGHLLLLLLGREQVDGEVDKLRRVRTTGRGEQCDTRPPPKAAAASHLRVASDEPLEPLFLEKLERVLFEREHDLGPAAERLIRVLGHRKGRVGSRLPHPLRKQKGHDAGPRVGRNRRARKGRYGESRSGRGRVRGPGRAGHCAVRKEGVKEGGCASDAPPPKIAEATSGRDERS